jgi:hypothetical protein
MTLLAALLVFQVQTQVEILPLVNPNTATKAELMAVDKAVTSEVADKIIKGRPYNSHDEVRKVIGDELWRKMFNFPIPWREPPPPPKRRENNKFDHQFPPLPKNHA